VVIGATVGGALGLIALMSMAWIIRRNRKKENKTRITAVNELSAATELVIVYPDMDIQVGEVSREH
jgi:hypothetical protein